MSKFLNPTNDEFDALIGAPRVLNDGKMVTLALKAWETLFFPVYNGKANAAIKTVLAYIAEFVLEYGDADRRRRGFINTFNNRGSRVRGRQKSRLFSIAKKTGATLNPFWRASEDDDFLADEQGDLLFKSVESEISKSLNACGITHVVPGKEENGEPMPEVELDLTDVEWDGDEYHKMVRNVFDRHVPPAANPLVTENAEIDACWTV